MMADQELTLFSSYNYHNWILQITHSWANISRLASYLVCKHILQRNFPICGLKLPQRDAKSERGSGLHLFFNKYLEHAFKMVLHVFTKSLLI